VSFVANTNWQGYSGEQTMSYLTQMLVLAGQNFFSAATGIAVAFALIRGFSSRSANPSVTSGSMSRAPRCTCCCRCRWLFAVFLMGQGVIQNF
jgi:K+-transporting ATPase ATPase A chain